MKRALLAPLTALLALAPAVAAQPPPANANANANATAPATATASATAGATAPPGAPSPAGTPSAAPPPAGSAGSAGAQPPPAAPAAAAPGATKPSMAGYHAAFAARRLGSMQALTLDDVRARAAEDEELLRVGRVDECIARLTELVEHPRFDAYAEDEAGRAAVYQLGDALATAGAYDPARAQLRRVLHTRGAWEAANGTYARRAVRRLVEIAIESLRYDKGLEDLADLPPNAPEETRGEVLYLTGRAKEAHGDPEGALASYLQVTQRSRFWAQSTYLAGLINVERGRYKQGEDLFCRIADPKRTSRTTPVFADERFFAVRDLARLALGRVAHEQFRFDDARYYYYLVPQDSNRLAEALYEAATSRYEKKDYEGARELLDQLDALHVHHPYEDEAYILRAYLDLAQCKFPDADKRLVAFLARYEPVRDAARRLYADDRGMQALLTAARTGSDAGGAQAGGATVTPETMRAVAALVRVDPAYGAVARKRAVLEHEANGLRFALGQVTDMNRTIATNGGVRPAVDDRETPLERADDARAALDGVRGQIEDLKASHAPASSVEPLERELASLEARFAPASAAAAAAAGSAGGTGGGATAGADLPDLLRADASLAASMGPTIDVARQELARAESQLAKDALRRLDLRLSRLLRRARLGRIESVLGRKRALEVEIEAINNGVLPASALDSLDASRYLKDNEEYWPFEGDDWPDEFVGGETLR